MVANPINFPVSTAPGINPTEGGGRLINAYAEKAPDGARNPVLWRRAPGLVRLLDVGASMFRGAIEVGSLLYVVNGNAVYAVTKSGGGCVATVVPGSVPGEGKLMMARNMRASPQVLIVHDTGMSKIEGGVVADFSDPDLPAINSITFMDGYFFVTSADGRVFASGINDVTFNALDYATAESSPDGLARAVAFGRDLLLMGANTVEFWGNSGNPTGFPFSRGPVIPIGLLGPYAITGHEPGFPEPLVWVANDRTVRRLVGYSPERISTPALERMIEQIADLEDIEASVYVAAGHACAVISSPSWTWVYDLTTGNWHERQSIGSKVWRSRFGVNAFNEWLSFDKTSPAMFRIDSRARREDTTPLVVRMISNQGSGFPGRFVVNRASFDIETGVGIDRGIDPIESDPKVSVSWSDDGGRTFGNALLRRLGAQGECVSIDVFRAGMTSRLGRQWCVEISDPVEVTIYGAVMDIERRSA